MNINIARISECLSHVSNENEIFAMSAVGLLDSNNK